MNDAQPSQPATPKPVIEPGFGDGLGPAEKLLARVRELLLRYLDEPRSEADVTVALDVQKNQVGGWLTRLVADGAIEKLSKPVRYRAADAAHTAGSGSGGVFMPAEELFTSARELLLPYLDEPRTEADVAEGFDVRKHQARSWLKRLVADGAIEKLSKPVRYRTAAAACSTPLFPSPGRENAEST